jgi:uncharacterized membrane protein YcaP (DUF421 family)
MDSFVRGLVVYTFLLVVFRLAGNRTLSQTTTFEFVLLLIISETTQQAMVDDDHSVTNAFLLILTLVGANVLLSFVKQWSPVLEKWLDGKPILVIQEGKLLRDRMDAMRVDEEDILEAARSIHGIDSLDDVRHAIVERSGDISIVPERR